MLPGLELIDLRRRFGDVVAIDGRSCSACWGVRSLKLVDAWREAA